MKTTIAGPLLFLFAAPVWAQTDAVTARVKTDPTLGALTVEAAWPASAGELSGWLYFSPGEVFGGRPGEPAPVRVVTGDGRRLYVDHYPEEYFGPARIVEAPLLFADGFESRQARRWSSASGPGLGDLITESEARLMAEAIGWVNVLVTVGQDSGGSDVDVIFSEGVRGSSASTDTPADVFFRHVMRPTGPVDWRVVRSGATWDIGGVIDHADYNIVCDNARNPVTHSAPLDDLRGISFKGNPATMYSVKLVWDAVLSRWYPEALADAQILWKGVVLGSSFSGLSDSEWSISIKEQTESELGKTLASPYVWRGLGRGDQVEDGGSLGADPRILRADHSGLRSTASQWWSNTVKLGADDVGSSLYTIFNAPTYRLRRDPSPNFKLHAQVRNAAGTWTTVGTSPNWTSDIVAVLVNYNSATTTAYLWVNGAAAGSTTITGGIYTATAAATGWFNSAGSIRHYNFRHGLTLLSDAEAAEWNLYPFDFSAAVAAGKLDCAIEFEEGSGTTVSDLAGNVSAILSGFSDADGSWVTTATGESAQAKQRTPVFAGAPFMAPALNIDNVFQVYSPGYDGLSTITRAVVADGSRLASSFDTEVAGVDYATFNATTQEIEPGLYVPEPAVDQTISFSAGANAGAHVVKAVTWSPILGSGNGKLIVNGTVLADETSTAGSWTSTGSVWDLVFAADGTGILSVEVASGTTGDMALLLVPPAVPDALVEQFIEKCGPQSTVTKSNIAGSIKYGWYGDGGAFALDHADTLARVTKSSDDGPTAVYRDSSGNYNAVGFDPSPASATYAWPEIRISGVSKVEPSADYDAVRVKYAKAWAPSPAGKVASTRDALARDGSIEWRSAAYPLTGGTNELTIESFFLERQDALDFATAMYAILSGTLYSVSIRPSVAPAEAAMAPFTAVSIEWSADSFFDSVPVGTVLAWKVNADKGASALVFFGG